MASSFSILDSLSTAQAETHAMLLNMGFEESIAASAAVIFGNDVAAAINYLTSESLQSRPTLLYQPQPPNTSSVINNKSRTSNSSFISHSKSQPKFAKIDQTFVSVVFGYTRTMQALLPSDNPYYTIPEDIKWIITLYYNKSIDELSDWLKKGGATYPKLFFKSHNPGYIAPHANTYIQQDEDFCFIPYDYIMTTDIAKASEIGQKIIASKVDLRSKHSWLASFLLQEREKGPKSKWYHYISVLPRMYESVPLFFNEQQLKLLIGSICIDKIGDRTELLECEYDGLCEAVPEYKRFSFKDFVWARLCVITRIFGLRIDDVKTDGLVPIADFFHHKRPRNMKWRYDQQQKGFVITALTAIWRNDEVFISFGRKCNSRYFVNYGFVVENNPDNEALMTFELPDNDPQYSIKARHLGFDLTANNVNDEENERDIVCKRNFQIPRQYKQSKVKEAFSYLRILHAQGNEFLMVSSANGAGSQSENIPPLSIRNELDVLTTLSISAQDALDKFPDSLEYDNELLGNEEEYPLRSNKRNIIVMRCGEKEVLRFYVELLKICQTLFKMTYKDLRNKIRKDKQFKDKDSPLMQYVNHVVIPLVQRQSESY